MLNISKFLRLAVPICFLALVIFSLPSVCAHGHAHDHHGHSHDHHGHTHDHGHSHDANPAFKYSKEANVNKNANAKPALSATGTSWLEPIGATLLISLTPYLILFFIPITNSGEHQSLLKVLLSFGSGGLLGDAFLHLIPHALMAQSKKDDSTHSHSHSHSHGEEGHSHDMTIGVYILAGIISFLCVDKIMRIVKGGHSHSHSHIVPSEAVKEKKSDDESSDENSKETETSSEIKSETDDIKVAGYLNLAADFTHNFTDGLAIGASFLAGRGIGLATTFTVLLHEIPHEIGDFAILVQSGCSKRKAMQLQLITAVGALAGCCISLMAEGADPAWVAWIIPFTAGGFIYIATVSVLPELLDEGTSLWQSTKEVVALLMGVLLMVAIVFLEEAGGHSH